MYHDFRALDPSKYMDEVSPGRVATVVVAAVDSSLQARAQADFVCDGVNDHVEIRAALAILPAAGGKVMLSEGNFSIAATISLSTNVILSGEGSATILKLANSADTDVLEMPRNANESAIESLSIDGNKANNALGSGIVAKGFLWKPRLRDIIIRDCPAHGVFFTSDVAEDIYLPVLINIVSNTAGQHGFLLGNTVDIDGFMLFAEGNGDAGAWLGVGGGGIFRLHIFDSLGGAGLFCANWTNRLSLIAPIFETNHQNGAIIEGEGISIIGGHSFDNGVDAVNTHDGIVILGDKNFVIGHQSNNAWAAPPPQRYGINVSGDDNIISENQLEGNLTGAILDTGARNVTKDNKGYVTENRGTATIAAGAVTAVVAHGLTAAPTNVTWGATTDTVGRRIWWSADAANITFTIDSIHTAGITLNWKAEV
ncbi:hypothetical protein ES705_08401 [subsurface metagenome]